MPGAIPLIESHIQCQPSRSAKVDLDKAVEDRAADRMVLTDRLIDARKAQSLILADILMIDGFGLPDRDSEPAVTSRRSAKSGTQVRLTVPSRTDRYGTLSATQGRSQHRVSHRSLLQTPIGFRVFRLGIFC